MDEVPRNDNDNDSSFQIMGTIMTMIKGGDLQTDV